MGPVDVRVKPAQEKPQGHNPATGVEIDIAANPASLDLKARPLAKAKAALPSVQKARRRLAAWQSAISTEEFSKTPARRQGRRSYATVA